MSSILFIMIIWTVRLNAAFILSASMHFIVKRMIFLFFPPVRKSASILILAAICICLNKMLCLPLRALFSLIIKIVRLPSKILPIMGINTSIPWMRCIWVRAPDCLEMKHIEVCRKLAVGAHVIVCILLTNVFGDSELVQQVNRYLIFSMSKGTHITIITRLNFRWVARAKFYLVLLWMIEFLNSIVRASAAI